MTRTETKRLLAGIVLGALGVAAFSQWRPLPRLWTRPQPEAATMAAPSVEPAVDTDSKGISTIELTNDEQRAIGIAVTAARRQALTRQILTTGRVEEPETGLNTISARIGGRVERLLLNVTGELVEKGQPVALIYSPELVSGVDELRLALEARKRLSASNEPEAQANADELIRASRRRLELWGLSADQIEQLIASPESAIRIPLVSQVQGTITKREVTEGQYVKEGDVLYSVADLTQVWVQADIFDSDVSLVRTGQSARITSVGLPGAPLRGVVNFINPSANPETRTVAARIQVENPQSRLRPGMFVQVSLEASMGSAPVAVPRSAVLDTGKEKVVYVARDNGVFEKRPIEGMAFGEDSYAVTRGLDAGENVVTAGNFLLDSQTRLTGTITGMFGGSRAFEANGDAAASGSHSAITFKIDPAQPKGDAANTFKVTLADPAGKPITDAHVQVTLVMPAMPAMNMPEMRSSYALRWNGSEYAGSGRISVAGPWTVSVDARRNGQLLGTYRTNIVAK